MPPWQQYCHPSHTSLRLEISQNNYGMKESQAQVANGKDNITSSTLFRVTQVMFGKLSKRCIVDGKSIIKKKYVLCGGW